MLRVLVVDESAERADTLRDGLARAGHEVVAMLSSPLELLRAVERVQPDVIIIDTDSPTRDVLEHLVVVSRDRPRATPVPRPSARRRRLACRLMWSMGSSRHA
jgi:response regulator NasT